MNSVNVQLVHQVIKAQGLNRLAAWNMGQTDQLYYHEARSAEELCRTVDEVCAGIDGPFKLEVWEGVRTQGRKAVGAKYFNFIIEGGSGRSRVNNDPRIDALVASVEKLTAKVAEQEDEEPEESEDGKALQALVIGALQKFVGIPSAAPAPAPAISGPSAPVSDMGEAEALDLLTKIAMYRQANPAEYAAMKAHLDGMFKDTTTNGSAGK